jgi:hypothetical protein
MLLDVRFVGAGPSPTFERRPARRAPEYGNNRKRIIGPCGNRRHRGHWRQLGRLLGLGWALLGPFLNLHLSGGPGGIAHVLEHLGPPMESWWHDLGTVALD